MRQIAERVDGAGGSALVTVDVQEQVVVAPGGERFGFGVPETLREMLLNGVDEIALTLSHHSDIDGFRSWDRQRRPWAYAD